MWTAYAQDLPALERAGLHSNDHFESRLLQTVLQAVAHKTPFHRCVAAQSADLRLAERRQQCCRSAGNHPSRQPQLSVAADARCRGSGARNLRPDDGCVDLRFRTLAHSTLRCSTHPSRPACNINLHACNATAHLSQPTSAALTQRPPP